MITCYIKVTRFEVCQAAYNLPQPDILSDPYGLFEPVGQYSFYNDTCTKDSDP
jgi:hypothetical protein